MDFKNQLVDELLLGNVRALARVITHIENQSEQTDEILNALYTFNNNNSHILGLTGPPGAGKSSIVNLLIDNFRKRNETIAIVAVDPSSPYSGGAILGDRIRMLDFTQDKGVYIRSMASRGQLGGLAAATFNTIKALEVFGFDWIIIETVGAGQSEVDIVKVCDTTIVVTVPGLGDDIQILKAGIMEIGDIFVVNKADKVGAKEVALQLKHLLHTQSGQTPAVCLTSTISGEGINELIKNIILHKEKQIEDKKINRQKRLSENILLQFSNKVNEGLQDKADELAKLVIEGKIRYNQTEQKLLETLYRLKQ